MPVYEFACGECGKRFTLVLSMKERESGDIVCPGCQSTKVAAVITSFSAKTVKKS